ncbi:MAG TPA: nucleotide pyrophosphohydrolase [Chloroflexi bacterium]|nr:nucleotide pyrophosphohydrolase [Chloroflexota bacterium]
MSNWQTRALKFARQHNFHPDPGVYALDCLSELGEVAKEILLATDYGQRPYTPTAEIAGELGDALYSLCLLAAAADVDLETAFDDTLAKYGRRWQESGHTGSQ